MRHSIPAALFRPDHAPTVALFSPAPGAAPLTLCLACAAAVPGAFSFTFRTGSDPCHVCGARPTHLPPPPERMHSVTRTVYRTDSNGIAYRERQSHFLCDAHYRAARIAFCLDTSISFRPRRSSHYVTCAACDGH